MEKFEQQNMPPPPTEEDLKHIEESERKKQIKRENRLKKIAETNSELLQSLFPKEANDFEIAYEEIQETKSSMFEGETTKFSSSDLPAYGIFLRLKSDPKKKYQITHWLRPDLDAKKANFEMMLNQNFTDKIKEGVEKLKSGD